MEKTIGRILKLIIIFLVLIIVLPILSWLTIFSIDVYRCSTFQEPLLKKEIIETLELGTNDTHYLSCFYLGYGISYITNKNKDKIISIRMTINGKDVVNKTRVILPSGMQIKQ